MKCPQCDMEMALSAEASQRVSECSHCGGVWHDGGVGDSGDGPAGQAPAPEETPQAVDPSHFEIRETALDCPRCDAVPLRAVVDRHSNAQVSICGRCRGVWLTASDYDDLVRTLSTGSAGPGGAEARRRPDDAPDNRRGRSDAETVTWDDVSAYFQSLQYKIFKENPKLRKIVESLERSLPL